ncbi:MAG: hypothetical protein KAI72_01265, partial [Candidatus Pacebacteria bacterium]|nr:hypothetical protein [Candidatus Paceibacterota bacterium]
QRTYNKGIPPIKYLPHIKVVFPNKKNYFPEEGRKLCREGPELYVPDISIILRKGVITGSMYFKRTMIISFI